MSSTVDSRTDVAVAVVDGHNVIHAGIQTSFAYATPPVCRVGSYDTVDGLLAEHPIGPAEVDVVVLDIELENCRPYFAAVERVTAAGPRAVVYSRVVHDEVILKCLDLGASAYVAESECEWHLLEAIRTTASDGLFMGPRMAHAMSNAVRNGRPCLTQREQDILVARVVRFTLGGWKQLLGPFPSRREALPAGPGRWPYR